MDTKFKKCKLCGRTLPVSEFGSNKRAKDGLDSRCNECVQNHAGIPQPGIKATFKISDFSDEMLFAELRRRGFTGELRYSKVVNV